MVSPGNSSVCREQALIVSLRLIEGLCATVAPFPSSLLSSPSSSLLPCPILSLVKAILDIHFPQLNMYLCGVFDLVP